MRRRGAIALALALATLGGCASKVCAPPGAGAVPPPPDWRDAATDIDHQKLRRVRETFVNGLAAARASGANATLGGRLFDPDYAQDGAALPPGRYRCTSYLLGATPPFRAADPRPCTVSPPDDRIEGFSIETGAQRMTGRIYPDAIARTVFLGTILLSDEATALHYGRDPDRDRVGIVQRIGPSRWRMTIPQPAWGGTVEIVEIVPAA